MCAVAVLVIVGVGVGGIVGVFLDGFVDRF